MLFFIVDQLNFVRFNTRRVYGNTCILRLTAVICILLKINVKLSSPDSSLVDGQKDA
ncbi:Uncharacterised protein [Vibrio cholerae]|nr:Uncharacterised protein [Vibrio cholerae]